MHLLSCDVNDDGVFKHLADPRPLNAFQRHRAVFVVGSPVVSLASVFRRKFQCWHFHRLQNCWFTRAERDGVIPCEQPGVHAFRRRFGEAASACRVPRSRRHAEVVDARAALLPPEPRFLGRPPPSHPRTRFLPRRSGPLSTLESYAEQGEDLFGTFSQFRAWLSCRRPRCTFDILVRLLACSAQHTTRMPAAQPRGRRCTP